ncbi:hypothetical protein BHE74_00026853 [Ensete ventricosum]|nr:hypothetical protein BHE74_00026853 [Ensete ventricosum]
MPSTPSPSSLRSFNFIGETFAVVLANISVHLIDNLEVHVLMIDLLGVKEKEEEEEVAIPSALLVEEVELLHRSPSPAEAEEASSSGALHNQ